MHVVRVDFKIDNLMIACVVFELINECRCCLCCLNGNVALNGGKWTQFEYVLYFAHKLFDQMPQWKLFWLFS